MRISDVSCHVLVDDDLDVSATSSSQDTLLVEIHTDEGFTGIGEADVNPWVGKACIEARGVHSMARGLREMLIGADPVQVEALWERLYVGSACTGRRGAGINAIGALDIALHDLRGKINGAPCWAAFGEKVRDRVQPYASLQPDVGEIEAYAEALIEAAVSAKRRGFRAAKASLTFSGPYAHKGMRAPWSVATEMIGSLRAALGEQFVLMVDVQYGFTDADTCLAVLEEWSAYGLAFVETPLWVDDLDGYARLVAEQEIPIAMGEFLTTRHEFEPLFEGRCVRVAQPDIGRVGGLTEARRVAVSAERHGLDVVPHLWKTGVSIAAALHFAAVTPNCQYIEFLPAEESDSAIRRELLTSDFQLDDGAIAVPTADGLGVELDRRAFERFGDRSSGKE